MVDVPVNYWAVLVGAIANMAIGFVWYGPLFGKQWTKLMGWTPEQMEAGKAKMKSEGWKTYGMAAIGALVMAFVMSHVATFAMAYMQTSGMAAGLSTGFWMWLGFVAPVTMSTVLWEGKSWKLWCLSSGYYLVALLVMGAIVAGWR